MKKIQNIKKAAKWIQNKVDPFCHSEKIASGSIPYVNTKQTLLDRMNHKIGFPKKLSQKKLKEHFAGERTCFFNGDWRQKVAQTLCGIDIDCHHGRGTLEAAIEAAEFLKNLPVFENLYFEVSTNGNGVHCYFVIEKEGWASPVINHSLKSLDAKLKKLVLPKFNITQIEIKGTLPVYEWTENGLDSITFGQALKLPRIKTEQQAVALMETCSLTLKQIHTFASSKDVEGPRAIVAPVVPLKERLSEGSTRRLASMLPMDQLKTTYMQLAYRLTEDDAIRLSDRSVATVRDFAIFLMLGDFFSQNMNEDGSLPVQRFKNSWKNLYESGVIDRQWNDKRFAAIRNVFSEMGLLDWESNEYFDNQACKWKFGDLLNLMIETSAESFEEVASSDAVGEERENLYSNKNSTPLSTLIKQIDKVPLLRPVYAHPVLKHARNWSPEEIGELVGSMN